MIDTEEPTDTLLGGRLRLRQAHDGHRAGTDAVLLAAATRLHTGERIVDVGAGVGTVGLALCLREPTARVVLLDSDGAAGTLAGENCRLNGVEDRARATVADLFDAEACRGAGLARDAATLVVTNPPFYLSAEARPSPRAGRARAHMLQNGVGHGDWLKASLSLLQAGGHFCAIHRPQVLGVLLAASENRLGALRVIPIHPRAGERAVRIILSGRKGSRAPLSFATGLVLHGPDGRFTAEAEAIHRGEATLVR